MKAALEIDEFLSNPIGRYFEASNFIYWYPTREMNGVILRGRPDSSDIQQLTQLMDAVLSPQGGPHVSLVDARKLAYVDSAAFIALVRYLETRWDAFGRLILRQALLRPVGLAGTVVAGFYQVMRPPYLARVFETLEDALGWLGPEAAVQAQNALAELEKSPLDPMLAQLRHLLESAPGKVAVAALARELGVSERTLQRRLRASGTTFQDEVRRARVRASQTLMLAGETKLTAIALEVGCASLQHYSALFRRVTGISPSLWRKRHALA